MIECQSVWNNRNSLCSLLRINKIDKNQVVLSLSFIPLSPQAEVAPELEPENNSFQRVPESLLGMAFSINTRMEKNIYILSIGGT